MNRSILHLSSYCVCVCVCFCTRKRACPCLYQPPGSDEFEERTGPTQSSTTSSNHWISHGAPTLGQGHQACPPSPPLPADHPSLQSTEHSTLKWKNNLIKCGFSSNKHIHNGVPQAYLLLSQPSLTQGCRFQNNNPFIRAYGICRHGNFST